MTPAEALHALRTTPETFLKHYPVNPAGTGAGGLRTYYIVKPDGQFRQPDRRHKTMWQDKPGHLGATRPGPFATTREISSFRMLTNPAPGLPSANTQALLVPLEHYAAPPAAGAAAAPGAWQIGAMNHTVVDATGGGVMVTGQLSGCCFCWELQGASLWAAHIKPVGIDADVLDDQIRDHGQFAGGAALAGTGALQRYGKRSYAQPYANVIGVRQAGAWRLYAQQSSDMFKTITAAHRIWPGPVVAL